MTCRSALAAFAAVFLLVLTPSNTRLMAQSPAAQSPTLTISGIVSDASGQPVAHASISLRGSDGAQIATTVTDSGGKYQFANLGSGDYEIAVSATGFAAKTARVSVAEGSPQTLNLELTAATGQAPLPNAPQPSLSDLGFSNQETQGDPKMQALLKRRTEMLRVHQRLGLITAIPIAAALITGPMAKAKGKNGQTVKEPTDTNLDLHAALGGAATALYAATAYYAIWAPRVPGTHKHGAIRVHEALAFVHGPGMLATGVLGYMAYKQENSGEKAHGIASEHGTVAYVTAIAYGTSIVAVSWPIHVKFWEKKQ
jgi:hypothetical protein